MNQAEQVTAKGRPLFRMVAIGSAALFLLSTAYQASWGQGNNGDYGDDDGLSGGETAAIIVGGAVGALGLWGIFAADDDDDDGEAEAASAPIPPSGGKATAARLVAPSRALAAGESTVFDLQVQRGGKWVNATNEQGSAIEVQGTSLTRMDGAKNAFVVPMTAKSGKTLAVGHYTQPDGSVLTATTTVSVGG